ncbi:MAG TPA: hypothetical protein PKD72_09410, partial [Gemmatales bacterium]|nr:hypothetical protein [Gemmatales bacterium]
ALFPDTSHFGYNVMVQLGQGPVMLRMRHWSTFPFLMQFPVAVVGSRYPSPQAFFISRTERGLSSSSKNRGRVLQHILHPSAQR